MEYTVVKFDDLVLLIKLVNQLIKEGWVLQGGVSVCESRSGGFATNVYAQALIRNKE